jgi:hypothetical protein
MAVVAHTQSAPARSTQRDSTALKPQRAAALWLMASPREALQIRSRSSPSELGLATPAADPAELVTGLRHWRARVQRRRAGVLLRRHAIPAAGLSIVLQALVVAGVIPQAVLLVPLAVLLLGVSIELALRPSLEEVAHLLDEQLGLFDRIATGLDIQRHVGPTRPPLEQRAVADASGLTAASLDGASAKGVPAAREWNALAGMLVVLAAVVLAGPSMEAGSSRGSASTRAGAAGTRASATASVRRSASAPKATGAGKKAAPPSPAHPKTATESHRGSSTSPSAGYHTLKEATQGHSTATSPGKGAKSALGASPAAKTKPGAAAEAMRNSTGAQGIKGSIGVGSAAKPGEVSAVTAPSQKVGTTAHSAPSNGATSKGGASTPSSKSTSAPSSAAKKGTGAAGAPTGSATAGHQRASTQLGSSRAISGQASHALPLQAEYAPTRAGKTNGASHSSTAAGGGGPGRSALVNGAGAASSAGAASTFAFVPPDGGALPEGNGELLISYFNSLGWVREQSW